MSRVIKFRAWHEGRKEWLHDGEPGCSILGETIWAFGEWCRVPIGELNDVVVEQFTGLLDKDGREVWEGDVVRVTPEGAVAVVTYQPSILGWTLRNPHWPQLRWDLCLIDRERGDGSMTSGNVPARTGEPCSDRFEVLGNVHQHLSLVPTSLL